MALNLRGGWDYYPEGATFLEFNEVISNPQNAEAHPECPFCTGQPTEVSIFQHGQEVGDGNISIIPALGMMIPGYFLTVSSEHVTSFAQLDSDQLKEVDETLNKYEEFLSGKFGNYFRFEHGSDNITECPSGGCLDHAHQHLIPDSATAERVLEELPWEKLNSFEEINELRGIPYVYLGYLGVHRVVPKPNLPSQWVRRKLAEVKNLPEWDWAIYHGAEELFETFFNLRSFPRGKGKIILGMGRDKIEFEET